jgi:hypothetical protein
MQHRRVCIFGHQTSLRLEPEYWGWLKEIAAEAGLRLEHVIEAIAVHRNPRRSLTSEIRVAVAAHFHGAPYPMHYCDARWLRGRDGCVYAVTAGRGGVSVTRL